MSLILRVAIIFVVIVSRGAEGRMFGLFSCPSPSTKSNINTLLLSGTWYEQQRYFNALERMGDRCSTATYSYSLSNPNGFGIKHKKVTSMGQTMYVEGTAKQANGNTNDGKYKANFPNEMFKDEKYWILDTDYSNYAIVWACRETFIFNSQELWILTRKKNPESKDVNSYRSIASSKGASTWALMSTTQNCS